MAQADRFYSLTMEGTTGIIALHNGTSHVAYISKGTAAKAPSFLPAPYERTEVEDSFVLDVRVPELQVAIENGESSRTSRD